MMRAFTVTSLVAADAFKNTLLQESQELGLAFMAKASDLVENSRAATGESLSFPSLS